MAERENEKKMSREKFFRIGGSSIAGLAILGVAGNNIYKMIAKPEKLFYNEQPQGVAKTKALPSPYRKVGAFKTEGAICAFDVAGEQIFAATSESLYIYDMSGKQQSKLSIGRIVRDMAIYNNEIYLLYPTKIEVRGFNGDIIREWEACSDESDYCSMTAFAGGVFVTDAHNKNICQYTLEGGFKRFINSPDEFIVPSYSFGITNFDGKIYCSNPGRHKVECYTVDGEFVSSFGESGVGQGEFGGCCNPVHLTTTASGDIITSEKGIPRICCYGSDGRFHATLLDKEALGYGTTAREVRINGRELYVVHGNTISTFIYDEQFAANTACADCKEECPLRRNTNI